MKIGIDASNIRSGGGLAHLNELLQRANPLIHKFDKIIVWSSTKTLDSLPSADWLIKKSNPYLNKNVIYSSIWKFLKRDRVVKKSGCNVLFLVDATLSEFHPSVTICHNILPFSKEAIANFKFKDRILIKIRSINALNAFRHSDKIIMLSNNSINIVSEYYKDVVSKSIIIPHGFNKQFENHEVFPILKDKSKYKLIYVSTLSPYKLQSKVVAAVHLLLDQGYDIELTLVGSELNNMKTIIDKEITKRIEYISKISYLGEIPNQDLPKLFSKSDIFVFASLCETFGISLLEAMASRIPIACSNRSAMPEILKDGGTYFDPNDEADIAKAIKQIITNPLEAEIKSKKAFEISQKYNWDKCTKETFELLVKEGLKLP